MTMASDVAHKVAEAVILRRLMINQTSVALLGKGQSCTIDILPSLLLG